jgi:alkaline phosphatase D
LERAAVDVFAFEGLTESKASFDRLRIQTSTGDDAWYPDCAAVSVDGELIYCASVSGVSIGNTGSEVTSWTDPEGLHLECGGCFDSPLTHGPFIGAPLTGGGRFWLRTDTARRVVLRLAPTEAELAESAPVSTFWTSEVNDFTGTTEVTGLAPGSTWAWDMEMEGLRYGPWTLRVPPADTDPTSLRLAFGSCGRDSDQPIFSAIRELGPDLFLFIGDNHYGNTDDLHSHRQFYRDAHSLDQRAQLMQEAGVLAVWDDHDYTNNNEDGAAVGKEEALRAFEEYWANGSYGSGGEPGIWSALRWGQVGIWLLDDRYYRGLEDDIFGTIQTEWLLDSLQGSDATFKLVAMGSQWTSRGTSDSFAAFPEAQTAFREALVERGIEGVVLMSGDIHRSETRLLPGASGGYDLPELTSSPLATSPATCGSTSEVQDCYDDGSSFLSVDIDTSLADPELVVRIHQEDGDVVAEWAILRSELEL